MTRAQKINGAKIEVASANDALTRYMKSNFREDSVRTFLLARVDRAHARLRQAESTPAPTPERPRDWSDKEEAARQAYVKRQAKGQA